MSSPICFLLGLLLGIPAFLAQEQTPTFRTNADLVLVDLQVLNNRTHAPAPLLQVKDLRVFEENAPQQITHFSRGEYPLSIVLLFDLTESVRGVLRHLAEGAKTALDHLRAEDEVSVMVYAAKAEVIDEFSIDRARTLTAINKAARMRSEGNAYFNEAVYQAAIQLRQAANPTNRRVIIWLTDNEPNVPNPKVGSPPHTESEAFEALHRAGGVVAPVLMRDAMWAWLAPMVRATEGSTKAHPPGDARKYAELTGGQAVGLRGKQPEERLAQLIDELRARYTIGYTPLEAAPAGSFRKIRVEFAPDGALRPKEWTILARQGYYRK